MHNVKSCCGTRVEHWGHLLDLTRLKSHASHLFTMCLPFWPGSSPQHIRTVSAGKGRMGVHFSSDGKSNSFWSWVRNRSNTRSMVTPSHWYVRTSDTLWESKLGRPQILSTLETLIVAPLMTNVWRRYYGLWSFGAVHSICHTKRHTKINVKLGCENRCVWRRHAYTVARESLWKVGKNVWRQPFASVVYVFNRKFTFHAVDHSAMLSSAK